MKIPVSWLRDFVSIPETATGRDVAEMLVGVGFEVEGVETVGDVRGTLVVGRVKSIEELTDFKKPIRWCQVEVGSHGHPDTPGIRGIICGARNFAEGDLVVIALSGTTLPGDFTITSRETYGHISDGMICSQRELGLGEDHSGIIILPAGSATPGDDAFPILGLGDEVLDVAVTPDRGYALSIRGIAREVAIAQGLEFTDPGLNLVDLAEAGGDPRECASDYREACDLITLRTLENFNPSAPSPDFMKARLAAAGMRSVSLAVDVTNYVMLELGQPLHAFDADQLKGTLRARRARKGEKLETLDHVVRELHEDDLVIADDERALALAGIMGGLDSEISESTTRIALEAAHFDAVYTAKASRRHKLSSEASRRFERGVDRMVAPIASARAAQLLIEFGGASHVGMTGVESGHDATVIAYDPALAGRVAGREYDNAASKKSLVAIGCDVDDSSSPWKVPVPSWRPDLAAPIDLVEEVIRIDGYNNVPTTLPVAPVGVGYTDMQKLRRRVGLYLAGRGLVEVRNYPFVGDAEFDAMGYAPGHPLRHAIALANPLSDEQPLMRTTLLPGLFGALARNASRGFIDAQIFEIASVSQPDAATPRTGKTNPPRPSVAGRPSAQEIAEIEALIPAQPLVVASVLAASTWQEAIELALSMAREVGVELTVRASEFTPWHPGRCAELLVGDVSVGFAGELAPRVIENFGLPKRSVAFELNLDDILASADVTPRAPQVWTFPIAKEDIALVVKKDVAAAEVLAVVKAASGELLEDIKLFDVYEGAQVPEGHKSLAFALRFRASDRTLSAEEVAAARQAGVDAAAKAFNATLRS